MSKCPFWSSKREKISCDNECPMNPIKNNDEICPFVEYLSGEKIVFKDIIKDEFIYSQDTNFDYMVSGYVGYKNH